MSKHTPGPWWPQESDHPGGLLIKPIPGQVVAQCDEVPEMKANADLIAAAPELLDACRKVEEAWCDGDRVVMSRAVDVVLLAIAKAEGRDPLLILEMSDQPVTCPHDGSRTDFTQDGRRQRHTCLAHGHYFIVEPKGKTR